MKRADALNFSNSRPRSDAVRGPLPTEGTREAEPKANRPPAVCWSDFHDSKPSPQSRPPSARKPAKHVEPAWEVLDDLPEAVPVMEREIQVIETYRLSF